ncbi:unnamed protein product [Moneuplotes crassus]|uniref:Uncharacterized protein n=2 Tax=Euplotes crassus TaxID=5936 RepID=A0AAD1X791_EUPCR|nr:unnamed protein product [Moneuplotes crassus]
MDPKAYKFGKDFDEQDFNEFEDHPKDNSGYEEGDPIGLEDLKDQEDSQFEQEFEDKLDLNKSEGFYQNESEQDQSEGDSNKEMTMEEAKNKIRIVFKYYASFGDRLNLSNIQASKVVKLMKDSSVIKKGSVTKKDVDILFVKINKSKPNMNFDDFVKLLFSISTIKYTVDPNEAFWLLLKNHIFPACDAIVGVKYKTKEIKENKIVTKLFNSIIVILHDIYQKYFTHKIKKSYHSLKEEMQESEKTLFEFLRDFEIFPQIINKSKVYNLWTQITEKTTSSEKKDPIYKNCVLKLSKAFGAKSDHFKIINENSAFPFGFFLDFLALIAITAYIEDESNDKVFQKVSIPESVVILLERMDLSRGFTSSQFGTSLLPPNHVIQQIIQVRNKENETDSSKMSEEGTHRSSQVLWNDTFQPKQGDESSAGYEEVKTSPKPRYKSIKGQYIEEDPDLEYDEKDPTRLLTETTYGDTEEAKKSITSIFKYYCAYGEPTNTSKLKSSRFIKLLKDSGIVK